MLRGFKEFILRGSVIDLAVGVVLGGAFGSLIQSLVADILTPLIGAVVGSPDFSALRLGPMNLGKFLNALTGFLMVALALYLLVVRPLNALKARKAETPEALAPEEVLLLREIRDLLKGRSEPS